MANNLRRATFSPPPGLQLGESDFSIPGEWCAGSNVRFVSGKMQSIGGWQVTNSSVGTDPTVQLLEWYSKDGTRRLASAGITAVVALSDSTLSTVHAITPAAYASNTNNRWTLDLWGDHLIGCFSGGKVYEWDLSAITVLVAVTNAPTQNTLALVTDTRQLMVFGTKEEVSGTFNPRCIRWSDTEANTVWTTLPSNLAGEYILDGSGGSIRCAKKIGNSIAVWTDDELFLGDFTGDPSNPWSFRRQAVGCGTAGESSACIADGAAYWISSDLRLMVWVPGSMPREIPGLPVSYITGTYTKGRYGVVWHNRKYNEIWFHPNTNGTFPQTYISVNVGSINSDRPIWSIGSMYRSAMHDGINDCYGFSWLTGKLYTHESGSRGDGVDRLSWAASALIYPSDGKKRVMITGMEPDIEGQVGNITCTISALDYPQGDETTLKTRTWTAGQDKDDFRASGKLMRIQISGNDGLTGAFNNTFARMGRNLIDYVELGLR